MSGMGTRSTGLVEREEVLASLARLLADALTGKGRVALVGGPVATGKSEVLASLAERTVERGALTVSATCSRLERDLPLGVMRQLLHDAPLVAEERSRALALLDEGAATMTSPDSLSDSLRRVDAQIVHALCSVLLELAERCPLVVVVDDVHDADRLSALCLAYLARRVRTARILVVFSHTERWAAADVFHTELLRQPHCRPLRLGPLSPAGVAVLVAAHLGPDAPARLGEDWYAISGGNPLLAAALVEDYLEGMRSTHTWPVPGTPNGNGAALGNGTVGGNGAALGNGAVGGNGTAHANGATLSNGAAHGNGIANGDGPAHGNGNGNRTGHEAAGTAAVVGHRYRQAVLACLQRGEPRALRVARGLAVVSDADSLAGLLGMDAAQVGRELHDLSVTGLLADGRFRHEAARTAILAEVDDQERMALHRRTAELGYDTGAPPETIADHLLRAGPLDAPWAFSVLEEAARNALRTERADAAIAYLRLAARECADEVRRARFTMMLVRAEWRLDPGALLGYLTDLAGAMQRGTLRGGDAVVLARALLWHGRSEDACEVLGQVTESGESTAPETVSEVVVAQLWLRATHPPYHRHLRQPVSERDLAVVVSAAATQRVEAALALAEILSTGPREADIATIERILRGARLDEMSMDTVESALLALVYAGHPDRAAPWCDRFTAETSARNAPSRRARLAAVWAEVALRQGDLRGAERMARSALEIIPVSSWGVAAGAPLSTLILALTAAGRHGEVSEHLEHSFPETVFQSRYGLHYLYARGRHSLASGYPTPALRDFQRCGELMAHWELDVPGLVPWRIGAAEACLRMGWLPQARELAEAQRERCGFGCDRVRGMAVRVLAATHELKHRPALLRRSVDLLQASGDRYELARTLVDLVTAHRALGEHRRADMIARRAAALAAECGAEPLLRKVSGTSDAASVVIPLAARLNGVLSDAERRVAALAAAGYTNREIADKLFITISTVEQHLTRTYRKLDVRGRADLPAHLEFGDHVMA